MACLYTIVEVMPRDWRFVCRGKDCLGTPKKPSCENNFSWLAKVLWEGWKKGAACVGCAPFEVKKRWLSFEFQRLLNGT